MTDSYAAPTASRTGELARAGLDPEVLAGDAEAFVLDRAFGDSVRRIVVREGACILDVLEAAEMPARRARRAVVRVNGEDVPMEAWETRRLKVGDLVAIGIRPANGGKSNPLRTILQIIVYAVAVVVGIFYGPGAAALVNAVGSFLINALVPPPKPKQDPKEVPTYAVEGAGNELRLFGQVPVVMGARRLVLPHAARPYTEIVGNDVHYRMLLTGGVGPAEISDIRVGETPIGEMDEFSMEVRTGAAGEGPVTLYTNQPRESAVGVILAGDSEWQERETDFDTDEISVDVVFPRGLVTYNDEGNRKSRTVNLEIRYSRVEAENWVSVTPTVAQTETVVRDIFGNSFTRLQLPMHDDFLLWRAQIAGSGAPSGGWSIKAADAKPVRRNRRWAVPRGRYRVQIRRTTAESTSDRVSDEAQWATLRSIKNEQPKVPPGTPLLALNIRATDRVNGQIEPISAVVTSIRPKWDGSSFGAPGPTRNPGDLIFAALTGPGNSRPQPLSRISTASLGWFAELCTARGWTADFVFEDGRSVAEVVRAIAACGRGATTRIDGRYGAFADVPRVTTGQLFTPRNSRGFRAKRRFLPDVHALRIPFPNEEKQHRIDERIVYADGYDESNATLFEVLTFDGITNAEKVHEHGRYYLAQLKLRPESYFLTTDIEHATVANGDVAYLQHDAILVGLLSARVAMLHLNEGGLCTGIRMDETAQMMAGKLYGIRVRRTDETFALSVVTAEGESRDLTFVAPVALGDAPRAGDLLSFGERGLETLEVIVRRKGRPSQDKTCEIEFEPYGHPFIDDATTGEIPPFDSRISDPYRPRPPQPEILSVVWGEDGIRVSFSIPASRQSSVAGFAVRWRETPDDGADGDWERLPQLAAGDRNLVTPAPAVGAAIDLEIVAFDANGERGPAARELDIESEESVAAPTISDVDGIAKAGPGGAQVPAVAVVYAPNLETRIAALAVQVGPDGADDGDWVSAGTLDPKAGQGEVSAHLPPGGVIDTRFRLESRRGAFSPWVTIRGIVMPPLVANDSGGLGGRPADTVLDELEDSIAAGEANAAAIIAEAARATGAEGAIQTQVTALSAEVTTARDGAADLSARLTDIETVAATQTAAVATSVETLTAQVQKAVLKATFEAGPKFFTDELEGNVLTDDPPDQSAGTYLPVDGHGQVWQAPVAAANVGTGHKGALPVLADSKFLFTVKFRAEADSTNGHALKRLRGLVCYDETGAHLGYYWTPDSFTVFTAAEGWLDEKQDVITAAMLNGSFPGTAFVRGTAFKWSNLGPPNGNFQVEKLELLDVTYGETLQAQITDSRGAIATLEGKTEAWLEIALSTGVGVDTFVRARSADGDGVVGIGADVVGIYNRDGDAWFTALKIAGGDVTVAGNIMAGGKVYIGSTGSKWELALGGKVFAVSDGDTLGYGVTLSATPDFDFFETGLAAKSASETYDLYADGATATSAVMRIKIRTPGTPVGYTKPSTSTDTGMTPKFAISKGADPDADSNLYTIIASFSVQATISSLRQSDPKQMVAQLGVYTKKSGVWTREGALIFTLAVASSGTGVKTYTATGSAAIALQSAPSDFGIHLESIGLEIQYSISGDPPSWNPYASTAGAVTQFGGVTWTSTPSSGTRSATPNGEKCRVVVRPKNIS